MIHIGATPETNQHGCLSLSQECELNRKVRGGVCGSVGGYCVSVITIYASGLIPRLGLSTACGYCGLGALAGVVVGCAASSVICHKCTPQSTDNHIPRRNVPITTESLCLPSTQAIVQQPEELAHQTIERNDIELTTFKPDPPPSYSTVMQMGYPPPEYSKVSGTRV